MSRKISMIRNDESDSPIMIEHGLVEYRLTLERYEYSVGRLSHDVRAGTWQASGMRFDDVGYWGPEIYPTFPTGEQALAWIQAQFDAEIAAFDAELAEIKAILAAKASPVERVYAKDRFADQEAFWIVCEIGRAPGGKHKGWRGRARLTIQETLTALDILYVETGRTVSIVGVGYERFKRTGYCQWVIPLGSNDYEVLGWRSRSGLGRYGHVVAA